MRNNFFLDDVRKIVYKIVYIEEGKIVVDIGVGIGFIIEGLIKKNIKVIVVD